MENAISVDDIFLMNVLKLQRQVSNSNRELVNGVNNWVPFFDKRLQKLVPQYDMCPNLSGDCMEK